MSEYEKSKLTKLLEKRKQLDAQIQLIRARERKEERRKDTRRKIIIGAIARSHMELYPQSEFTQELNRLLNQHVTTPKERTLLGLEIQEVEKQKTDNYVIRKEFQEIT